MGKIRMALRGFFVGKRRECEMLDFHVHKDQKDQRWIRLSVSMPLSGQPVDGMPDAIMDQFTLMEKEDSAFNSAKNEFEIYNASFAIYVTDTIANHIASADGVTLQGFQLVGDGVADKRKVSLEFTADMPYSVPLRDWACDHLHSKFWVYVESSQMEITQVAEDTTKKKNKSKQQALPVQ